MIDDSSMTRRGDACRAHAGSKREEQNLMAKKKPAKKKAAKKKVAKKAAKKKKGKTGLC